MALRERYFTMAGRHFQGLLVSGVIFDDTKSGFWCCEKRDWYRRKRRPRMKVWRIVLLGKLFTINKSVNAWVQYLEYL